MATTTLTGEAGLHGIAASTGLVLVIDMLLTDFLGLSCWIDDILCDVLGGSHGEKRCVWS